MTLKEKVEEILKELLMIKIYARSSLDYEQPISQATTSLLLAFRECVPEEAKPFWIQVEEGEIKADNPSIVVSAPECAWIVEHNQKVIDLCNAHWAKKLERVEEVLQDKLQYYVASECPSAKELAQAIITYLTKKEK